MSGYTQYPSGGSGGNIPTYANFASLPGSANDGDAGITLDTDSLYIFNAATTTWVLVGSGTLTPVTVGSVDAAPKVDVGATIGTNSLFLQYADLTYPGLVSSGTQFIAGNKFFRGSVGVNTGSISSILDVHGETGPWIQATSVGTQSASGGASIAAYADPGSALLSGNRLGFFGLGGVSDGTHTLNNSVAIQGFATENWGASARGSKVSIYTTPNQTAGVQIAATIDQDKSTTVLGSFTSKGMQVSAPLRSDASGWMTVGSVNLATDVTGSLSATQIGPNVASGVGALDGATAKATGATIGTSLLYMQSASATAPGLVNNATQFVTGIKSFERIGLNNTSGSSTVWITTSSASLSDPGLTIKAIPSQTGDLFQIFDNANSPQAIFDSGGNFKFFHNTLNTSRFDLRPSINTSAINSGSANNLTVRYSMFVSQSGVQATGVGGGIALGGPNNVGTNTTYGAIWVTKDNGVAGDVAASMHLATKNNSTGNFQRAIDIDAGGNTTFAGTIAITGSVASKVTIGMPTTNTPYNWTLPVSQGSASWVLTNDGAGVLSWVNSLTNPMTAPGDFIIGSGLGTPVRLAVGPAGYVPVSDTTASNSISWQSPSILGNRIVNSGLDFWQAAGSGAFVTGTSAPGLLYTGADQFWLSNATVNSLTLQIDQVLPQLLGSRFGARIVVATNVAGTVGFSANNTPWVAGQMLSSVASRDFFGQRASAAVQLKATNYETAANIAIVTNTTETVSGYTVVASATVTITSASFTNVALSNILIGTAHGITGVVGIKFSAQTVSSGALASTVGAGSGLFFEQPVMNVGPVPVPFSRQYSDPANELASCMYFYERFGEDPGADIRRPGAPIGTGTFITTTAASFYLPYKVQKRTTCTLSYSAAGTFQARTSANNYAGSANIAPNFPSSGLAGVYSNMTIGSAQTANNSCFVMCSGSGFITADARMG